MPLLPWTLALTLFAPFTDDPKPADADAPLAQGFPDATKPGTIEIKKYPEYRSAEASLDKATMKSGDTLFFPLFRHIQKNDIAMTAPVISTYKTPEMVDKPDARGEMMMEFVYRTPTQGKTGPGEAMVTVHDHAAQTVVAFGYLGDESDALARDGIARLREWLKDHKSEWTEDGPPRSIGYHSPMTPATQRWWEAQIPVKAVKKSTSPSEPPTPTACRHTSPPEDRS